MKNLLVVFVFNYIAVFSFNLLASNSGISNRAIPISTPSTVQDTFNRAPWTQAEDDRLIFTYKFLKQRERDAGKPVTYKRATICFNMGLPPGQYRNLSQCYERWQHILKVLRQQEQARAQAQAEARVKVEAERKAWVQAAFNHGAVKVNVDELLKPDASIVLPCHQEWQDFSFREGDLTDDEDCLPMDEEEQEGSAVDPHEAFVEALDKAFKQQKQRRAAECSDSRSIFEEFSIESGKEDKPYQIPDFVPSLLEITDEEIFGAYNSDPYAGPYLVAKPGSTLDR